MKGQRRHDLETNYLADRFATVRETVGPYSGWILAGLALLAVLVVALIWRTHEAGAERAAASDAVFLASESGDLGRLEELAKQYAGTDVGHQATLLAADSRLFDGCDQLFRNKANAGDQLRRAATHYRTIQKESRRPAELEQAAFGLARAYEALAGTREAQGELEKAIEQYTAVVEQWPDGPYAGIAANRLAQLDREENRAFYDKFANYDPKPAFTETPDTSASSASNDLSTEASFPALPVLPSPPASDTSEKPAEEAPKPAEKPAEEAPKPAEKPAAKPAEEAPKPAEKPAAKPAEEAPKPAEKPAAKPVEEAPKPAEKPAAKPAEEAPKPAEKPAAKPAEEAPKPAEKPAAKPAEEAPKPAEKPAPKPAE